MEYGYSGYWRIFIHETLLRGYALSGGVRPVLRLVFTRDEEKMEVWSSAPELFILQVYLFDMLTRKFVLYIYPRFYFKKCLTNLTFIFK